MNVVGILQARVSSSRLPGKVLAPILGQPMLMRQIERLRRAKTLELLVVATSTDTSDDPLAQLCADQDIACHRGSLNDVLDRFYGAAQPTGAHHIVRLTGDCPLADPAVIDSVVRHHIATGADYTTNAIRPTWPDGLDVEVMRASALEKAWQEARLPSEREHVTPFIHKQPQAFHIEHVLNDSDLSSLRWTVDEPEDLLLVRTIYEALYPGNQCFSTADILAFLAEQPVLSGINTAHQRNEGYGLSLLKDNEFKEIQNGD